MSERTVRITRSLGNQGRWLVEYQASGGVSRIAGSIVKCSEGWFATSGFYEGTGPELGPFRLRREASSALVERAMAGAAAAVQARRAA
jgi:hypothetical protein